MTDQLIETLKAGNNCEFFKQMRDYEASMKKRLDAVIFAVVLTVATSLIGLIVGIAIKEWGVTAATAIGTVVSGTAMKFILDQKKDHQEQVDRWIKAISDNNCA